MSLERICPSCFKGTKYTVSLPSSCSHCSKAFTFAFAKKRPQQSEDLDLDLSEDSDEDEEINEVIVASKAREYKNILRGIKVRVDSNKKKSIQLGNLLNNPDDYKELGQR